MLRDRAILALAVVVLTGLGGCGGAVPAPKSFEEYRAEDGSFTCMKPVGWAMEQGSRKDNSFGWGRFSNGAAEIKITADATGSLLHGGPSGGMNPTEESEKIPVRNAHEEYRRFMEDELSGYKEKQPADFRGGMGPVFKSEFIASGGMGGRLHGYRATALSNDRRVVAVCKCPEKSWKTLKPAFDKVIASIKH